MVRSSSRKKIVQRAVSEKKVSYRGLSFDGASSDASSAGLTQEEYQRFSYDANGNRLSLNQETNQTVSYLYKANTNILQTIKHIKRVDQTIPKRHFKSLQL